MKVSYRSVFAGGSDGADDVDLLNEEEVDDNLGGGVQGQADKDGEGAGHDVSGVGRCQHGSHGCEEPRDDIERDDETSSIVDVGQGGA